MITCPDKHCGSCESRSDCQALRMVQVSAAERLLEWISHDDIETCADLVELWSTSLDEAGHAGGTWSVVQQRLDAMDPATLARYRGFVDRALSVLASVGLGAN